MMNDSVDITKDRASYLRLDRFLLYLLMAELGYFILLIFICRLGRSNFRILNWSAITIHVLNINIMARPPIHYCTTA